MPEPKEKPRLVDSPEPGFFKVRLVKGGPWVGAKIEHAASTDPETGEVLDRSPMWSAFIDGQLVASPSPDPLYAGVFRIWHSGRTITQLDYELLTKTGEWARAHSPNDPAANPRQPINLLQAPLP